MEKDRILSYLKSFGLVVLYLCIFMADSKLVGLFFDYAAHSPFKDIVDILKKTFYLDLFLTAVLPFLVLLLIACIRKINLWQYCKFNRISLKNVVACIITGISISVFILCFLQLFTTAPALSEVKKYFSQFDTVNALSYIFVNFIIYTIYEETLFRGLIYNELRKIFPFVIAVVIQGLPAAFQRDIGLSFFGYVSMVIYCLAYTWSGSLWGSVILLYTSHTFVLLTRRAGIITLLANLDNWLLITGTVLSLAVTVYSLYYLWKKNRQVPVEKYKKTAEKIAYQKQPE